MYLITTYFDDQTNKYLSQLIDEIAEKTGNDFMTENHVPPHMTITAVEQKDDETALSLFHQMENELKSGEVFIASVGAFLPYVIYAEAVQNSYLYEMSKSVYARLINDESTLVSKYYQPLQWIPHITLGKQLSKEQMKMAFEILQEHFTPHKAQVVKFGIAKTNPHRDLEIIELC